MLVRTLRETERGCGYRRSGKRGYGLYLCGSGQGAPCDRLPFPTARKHTRSFFTVTPTEEFNPGLSPVCWGGFGCNTCVVCAPVEAGVLGWGMWVGKEYYPTAEAFVTEARVMGVSKRISALPQGFHFNQWFYLAHLEATEEKEPGYFYVFKPNRVEVILNELPPSVGSVGWSDYEVDLPSLPPDVQKLVARCGEDKVRLLVVERG